jgi:hypothetical protein
MSHFNFDLFANKRRLFLYEESKLSVTEEVELREFLRDLKIDLLGYLQKKYEQLLKNSHSFKVYNELTLAVIKIL